MRLQIEIPASWPRSSDRLTGEEAASIPGEDLTPDAWITWGPLTTLPDEQRSWIEAALRRDIPTGTVVQITSNVVDETTTGWPVRVVEVVVMPESGAPAIEWRMFAFYAFFEHAAIAWSRASDEARYRARLDTVRMIMLGATPDWSSEPACLTELWDVVTRSAPQERLESQQRQHEEHATALGTSGLEPDAIAVWEAAAAADPTNVDALFNVGIACSRLGDHAQALDAWQRALERAPREFWITRKVIQSHHALGQLDAAASVRASLLEIWQTSRDPAVRLQDEYVFDQFSVGANLVHAFETLRPRDPSTYPLYTFRVVDSVHQTPRLEVALETSEYAKARSTPYVLSVLDGTTYRAIATSAQLPPYGVLKKSVVTLLEKTLAARARLP